MHFRTAILGLAGALSVFLPVCPAVFGQTPGLAPTDPEGQMVKAEILLEESKPTEALAILENLLQEYPEMSGVRYLAGRAAHLSGDSTKASSLAAEALQRNEETSDLQVLIGVIATRDKKVPEALRAFGRAVELDPKSGIALYNLSEALREEGRSEEAIKNLEKAIELEPEQKLLRLKLRLAQMETKEGYEEIETKVISRQNDEGLTEDWLMTAAAVHLKKGNYRQASDAIRAAKAAAGSQTVRLVVAEDLFFRKFANDSELGDIRSELGLK